MSTKVKCPLTSSAVEATMTTMTLARVVGRMVNQEEEGECLWFRREAQNYGTLHATNDANESFRKMCREG